jgi:uncharacterized protein YqgC (DUF456 family)
MSDQIGNILYLGLLAVAWVTIPIGLPGTLIMVALSLLYGWLTGFREMDGRTLLWMAAIAVPVEGLDQLLGIWAAKRYGATFKGILGSVAGGILGSMLLSPVMPIVGTVIGAFAGAFVGAYLIEWLVQKDSRRALEAAWGGFVGRIAGIILKMLAGGWMLYLAGRSILN